MAVVVAVAAAAFPSPTRGVRASRSLCRLCPSFGCFHGRHLVGSFTPRGARARKERGSAGSAAEGASAGNAAAGATAPPRGESLREGEGTGRSGGMGSAHKRGLERDRGTRRDTYEARTRTAETDALRSLRTPEGLGRGRRGRSNWCADKSPVGGPAQKGRPADRPSVHAHLR